ncbi:MAG: beta-ketoacyl-ACP synthase II [Candidatus Edwardsbacteria bacterium]
MRRVVVTGMGAITPVGLNVEEFWSALKAGKNGVTKISRFDATKFSTQIAAEVKGFEPEKYIDKKEIKRMDRFVQFALASAIMAMKDAELKMSEEDLIRSGVIVASGIGGIESWEVQHHKLLDGGPDKVSPFFVPMMIIDLAAGYISMRLGIKGVNFATVSACASSSHAIGEAFRAIKDADCEIVIAGGAEAAITPLSVAGFCAMRALSKRNDAPEKASRPFDLNRDGFVIGEGGGIVILEELEHALRRNAKIYAEVVGYGATADAYHITAPAPGGEGAMRSMQLAMREANLRPEEIDYINAHGTSTDLNDKIETMAIKQVFGEHSKRLAISSTKSMIGHLLGASGAVEFIATCLTIKDSVIHPTINYETLDPECDLDYVPNTACTREVKAALSNSFGFGGHNVTLAVKKFNP